MQDGIIPNDLKISKRKPVYRPTSDDAKYVFTHRPLSILPAFSSRLDYGNATLSGLPDYQFRRLQSAINAAATSIFNLRWSDHITPALMELHWLSAVDRVDFKVATLVFRSLMILLLRTCHHRYIVSQTWTLDVGLGHRLTQISI